MFILSLLHKKISNNIEQIHSRRVYAKIRSRIKMHSQRERERESIGLKSKFFKFWFHGSLTFLNCFRMFKNW